MSPWREHLQSQIYFLGLAMLNTVHGLLPFSLRPLLYRLCRYDIAATATLQGGVRFFHIGRLQVGAGTLVNRGVLLDNRAGIRIGRQVSIAHDVRIYTLGHDPRDANFATKGQPVQIDDHAVVFAGAMIMPGVHLGRGAVVMAGSVVTKDVPPLRMVGGNPARDIGPRELDPQYRLSRRYWFAH
jgi:acetyltransferase-like isoleucine patch superfamily enzyme